MAEKKTDAPAENAQARYSKSQLLASKRYADRRDLLTALLEDGASYTHAEAEKRIEQFMKRKVD